MNVREISQLEKRYYKLLLIVGTYQSGKTVSLKKYAEKLHCSIRNLNYEISKKMIDIPPDERDIHIDSVIGGLIPDNNQPLIIDNIEILFSPDFQTNPLQILKRISRTHVVISSWPGSYSDGRLVHGDINDDEYFIAKGAEIEDIEIYSLPENG
jgi:predicted HTH domain antitoxin